MLKLLLATQNQGKVKEMRSLLADLPVEIITPTENFDVDETGTTFQENARLKAVAFHVHFGAIAISDDSGLVVDALDGRPGVYSKRYGNSDEERNIKLLGELQEVPAEKRTARFISVIALYGNGYDEMFEGKVEGRIATEVKGGNGFGYDPLFIPEGYTETFGELSAEVKNSLSHRGNAMKLLKEFLAKKVPANA